MKLANVGVGDVIHIYDVANGRRSEPTGIDVEVVKVTPKTVYATSYGRKISFDKATGNQTQDRYSHYRAWVRRRWRRLDEQLLDETCRTFISMVHYAKVPETLTVERIKQIAEELGVNMEER